MSFSGVSRRFGFVLLASALSTLACGAANDEAIDPLRECVITTLGGDAIPTGSYERTGRIVTRVYIYELDEVARTIAVHGNESGSARWYWTNTYDSVGHLAHQEHLDGSVLEYTNTYDGDRITKRELTPIVRTYQFPGTDEYFYEDGEHPELWTRQESASEDDQQQDSTWLRTIESGRATRAELFYPTQEGPYAIWTYAFEGDVLTTIERDRGFWEGADGTPNIRFSWFRDAEGRLTAFEQDGTDSTDDPHIDGLADYREAYSPGCGELLQRFPWLAHIPDRDEVSPDYRVAGVWRPEPTR